MNNQLPPPQNLSGWGNYPVVQASCQALAQESELAQQLAVTAPCIARGLGRSYGDAALADRVLCTERFNRMLHFDPEQGVLLCEAGTSFADILETFVPRGFFLPVTPGTKYITVGGAIAADIHGKNHHLEGSFCRHVLYCDLIQADGTLVRCGPDQNPELFDLTRGGMGLSGLILRAAFRLKPIRSAYISQVRRRCRDLDVVMAAFQDSANVTYTVAWIDGLARGKHLGRSVLFCGEHAEREALPPKLRARPLELKQVPKFTVPFALPSYCLNPLTVRAFNTAFFHRAPRQPREELASFDSFFYPLDRLLHWNRLYGKKGFSQYQFVLPLEASKTGMRAILDRIAASGQGSFLSVLKLFGPQEGSHSFPRQGYTLALDFPIRPQTSALLATLDAMVLDHGGRIYLAKDAHMSPETFAQSYPHAQALRQEIARRDPDHRFRSHQSQRLGVTP